MSEKRQKTQYSLALEPRDRGEAPVGGCQGAEPLVAKSAPESPAWTEQLMETVCSRENLETAWKRVRSNKGSPGVDGMTIDDAKGYLREHWPSIRSRLLEGTYQPQPVKRVEIPKSDGGVRKLGVPCVVHRLIQQALLQVLQEQWDPTFSEHSYGFRPGRGFSSLISCGRLMPRVRRVMSRISVLNLARAFGAMRRSPYLIGWRGYFGFCQTPRVLTHLEAWSAEDYACISLAAMGERAQPLQGTAPSWRTKVRSCGRRRFTDGILAHVRTPGGPTRPAQPLLRASRSPSTPCLCPSLIRSNRRGTDPYARWCVGGAASRGVPLSRSILILNKP